MCCGKCVFVAGGTGYLGLPLVQELVSRGHDVWALTRGKAARLPDGCRRLVGNALDATTYLDRLANAETFVHLVGTPHPAPWKGRQFREVDLVAFRATLDAAKARSCKHFVYVSVAQPAPVMQNYIEVRQECERMLKASGLNATILRPWYVLGEGHRWPAVLLPIYRLAERIPLLSSGARRLGLVTHMQMLKALLWAVEHPVRGIQVVDVLGIRETAAVAGWARSD